MKALRLIISAFMLFFISCDGGKNATVGGTVDTAHDEGKIIKPTNPPDSTIGKDSSAKGNADPSGSIKKSN